MLMWIARISRGQELRELLRSERGAVAIEMALVAPFMIFMFMGAFDFGMAFCETQRYASAARAGAQDALISFARFGMADPGQVEAAAEEEYGEGGCVLPAPTPTFSADCWCPDPDGEVCACDSPPTERVYISVTVDGVHDLFFNYPGVPNPVNLTETAQVRLR